MAYQTGIASSPTDLLQKLCAWLVTNGWTQDMSQAEGNGWRAHLHLSGVYANLRAAINESIWPTPTTGTYDHGPGYGIGLYLGDGYNGALAWHLQSGRPLNQVGGTVGCGANLPAGAVAGYHFFAEDGHVVAVVERAPGIFCFLGWGPSLFKLGHSTDYPYFFASSGQLRNTDPTIVNGGFGPMSGIAMSARPPTCHADKDPNDYSFHATAFVNVDASVFTPRWISNPSNVNPAYGYTGMVMRSALTPLGESHMPDPLQYVNYNYILDRAHQAAFTGALILPLHLFLQKPTTLRWAPIGYPPNVFWTTAVGRGSAAKEILQVGGQDYMAFPGFCVRKVA